MIQYRQSRGAKLLTVNGKLTHKKMLDKHQIALYNVITAKNKSQVKQRAHTWRYEYEII